MTRILFILLLAVGRFFIPTSNQNDIIGVWATDDKEAKIKIYESDGAYFGKVIWLKEPNDADGHPKKDLHNPDPSKRNNPAIGIIVLKGLRYSQGVWTGKVYGPKRGKGADCVLQLRGMDTLEGTMHYGLLSGRRIWTRIK